ncbi:MAG: SLBB domain-containing protein [Oscillatoriaceae bacterium SKW80]|nr:SLBB domain-containing protein [Oscillatoriaceae bacterium SKYG93]MCX8121275.1 SLBB domain-containing protein [Oscillatoriaceae bacterium SKW80]MDW8453391.1 SLBB domain-containing protein [Oscillatoriaceae cyanobacterium SKYGB_i_bin93]HIK26746.1 SLBB domain-containing protein [Oscillatoriaceae cyanobacterium M7585_C2015_266]
MFKQLPYLQLSVGTLLLANLAVVEQFGKTLAFIPNNKVAPPQQLLAQSAGNFSDYRLGAGDQIFIQVQRHPELTVNSAITPEGTIVIPGIGKVFVQGLTIAQAEAAIALRLNQFYVNPIVSVTLLAQRPLAVTITGEVARPGFYPLQPNISLSEALLIAGGVTPASNLASVKVRRTLATGEVTTQTIDLLTPIKSATPLPSFTLSDGDVIIVPKQDISQARNDESAAIARSKLAAQVPVSVTVTGEVSRPGLYPLPPTNARISDALLAAGGVTQLSDLRSVRVRRITEEGKTTEQTFDLLTPLQKGDGLPELRLANGDTIIVPKQDIRSAQNYNSAIAEKSQLTARVPIAVTVTGEVAKPGLHILPAGSTRISDALLIAGGITAASDIAAVRVRRILADNSVIEQTLNLLKPLQTGEPLPDFRLAEGDTLIVPKRALGISNDSVSALAANSTFGSQAPVQVTITGEVTKPGFYSLPPAAKISDAILIAGGTTLRADLRAVRVRRALGDGRFSEEIIDLFTPLQNSQPIPDLRLATGDAVVVSTLPPGEDLAYDRQLVARSTLAKPTISVRILSYAGGNSGTLELPNGSTFADALRGIPLDTANLRKIALIRFDPEQGKAVTLHLDGKQAIMGNPSQNPLLQDNDAIVIGRNLVARITYALNTFTQPFRDILGFLLFFQSLQNSARDLFGPGR